jgi:uncharacterized LabA/DUF88 family protein
MDIELAIDMLEMSEFTDHAILFSGDGDFRSLVEAVQRKGTRVTVVSSLKTQPPMVSDELRRQADNFIDVADLADTIARKYVERPTRHTVDDEDDDEEFDDYEDEGEAVVIRRT